MAELDVWAAIRKLQQQFDRLTSFEWPLYQCGSWTPTWVGLTIVGAPTYAGRYMRIGRIVFFEIEITAGGANTTASVAGTTQMNNLPFTAAQNGVLVVSSNTVANYGAGWIQGGTKNCYPPAWAATNQNISISGWYEI